MYKAFDSSVTCSNPQNRQVFQTMALTINKTFDVSVFGIMPLSICL